MQGHWARIQVPSTLHHYTTTQTVYSIQHTVYSIQYTAGLRQVTSPATCQWPLSGGSSAGDLQVLPETRITHIPAAALTAALTGHTVEPGWLPFTMGPGTN